MAKNKYSCDDTVFHLSNESIIKTTVRRVILDGTVTMYQLGNVTLKDGELYNEHDLFATPEELTESLLMTYRRAYNLQI